MGFQIFLSIISSVSGKERLLSQQHTPALAAAMTTTYLEYVVVTAVASDTCCYHYPHQIDSTFVETPRTDSIARLVLEVCN